MDRYYITVAISGTISRMNKVAQESHFQHCFPVLNQDVLFLSGFFFFFFWHDLRYLRESYPTILKKLIFMPL